MLKCARFSSTIKYVLYIPTNYAVINHEFIAVMTTGCRRRIEEEERDRERKREEKVRRREDRRRDREEKRRLQKLEAKRREEERKMQRRIAVEERKILIAQRKLETIRLLSELFARIKVLSFHFPTYVILLDVLH